MHHYYTLRASLRGSFKHELFADKKQEVLQIKENEHTHTHSLSHSLYRSMCELVHVYVGVILVSHSLLSTHGLTDTVINTFQGTENSAHAVCTVLFCGTLCSVGNF